MLTFGVVVDPEKSRASECSTQTNLLAELTQAAVRRRRVSRQLADKLATSIGPRP